MTQTKEKAFKDTSIFDGVAAYVDDRGTYWRRMNEGSHWNFYILHNDDYILDGSLNKPHGKRSIKTVKEVHYMYLNKDA